MTDNRIYWESPWEHPYDTGSTTYATKLEYRASLVARRDEFRALFPGPQFVVSDIGTWVGSAASRTGYAFILRDTTFGHEYLFVFRYYESAGYGSDYWNSYISSVGATFEQYFKMLASGNFIGSYTTNGSNPLVFMNKSYATSTFAMGFTNTTALTYGGGDFTTVATNPYSSFTTFMNVSTGWIPGTLTTNLQGSNCGGRWAILYDTAIGVARFEYMYGSSSGDVGSIFMGRTFKSFVDGGLDNSDDTDVYSVIGVYKGEASNTMPGNSVLNTHRMRCMFNTAANVQHVDGTPANYLSPSFTRFTYRDSASTNIKINPILISNGSYIKGYVDPRIFCEALPANDHQFRRRRVALPDADNPMVKDHSFLITMWKKNTALIGELAQDKTYIDFKGIYT